MLYFHGTDKKDFKIEKHISSRYGFTALFLSDTIEVAMLYATHHCAKNNKKDKFIYAFENPTIFKTIDFNLEITHTAPFRNLIHKLFREQHKSVLIKNTLDYPSENLRVFIPSSILVVFDTEALPPPVLFVQK